MISLLFLAAVLTTENSTEFASQRVDQNLILFCTATDNSTVSGSYTLEIGQLQGKLYLVVEPQPGSKFPVEKLRIPAAHLHKLEFSDAPAVLGGENWIETNEGRYRVSVAADVVQDEFVDFISGISIIPSEKYGGLMGYKVMQTNCQIKDGSFPVEALK